MTVHRAVLFRGGIWTIGTYAASLGLRLLSNIVLSYILAPEAMGVLFIVSMLRVGVELLTDLGIEQNIVNHRDGLSPAFLDTAWTVQIIRGLGIGLLFAALAVPLASFYAIDPRLLLAMSLAPVFNSFASVSIFVLVRELRVRDRNLFELSAEALSFVVTITLALALRTVWAPVIGAVCAMAIRAMLSYLIPHPRLHFRLKREYVLSILHFGKWIFLVSMLNYAASNIDRIILGHYLEARVIGIFGLARIISEIPATLSGRVAYQIVLPAVAASRLAGEDGFSRSLRQLRLWFVFAVAVGLGGLVAFSDIAVHILYDARYRESGWMLFGLLIGAWFAVIAQLNEATLIGLARPNVTGYSNGVKFAVLTLLLPLALMRYGIAGAVAAIVLAEMLRFAMLFVRTPQGGFSAWRQDVGATLLFIAMLGLCTLVRGMLGLGYAWSIG